MSKINNNLFIFFKKLNPSFKLKNNKNVFNDSFNNK